MDRASPGFFGIKIPPWKWSRNFWRYFMCHFLYYFLRFLLRYFLRHFIERKVTLLSAQLIAQLIGKNYLKKYILKFSILICGIISNNLVELILEVSECINNVRFTIGWSNRNELANDLTNCCFKFLLISSRNNIWIGWPTDLNFRCWKSSDAGSRYSWWPMMECRCAP